MEDRWWLKDIPTMNHCDDDDDDDEDDDDDDDDDVARSVSSTLAQLGAC